MIGSSGAHSRAPFGDAPYETIMVRSATSRVSNHEVTGAVAMVPIRKMR
jgi:hypothetical protein